MDLETTSLFAALFSLPSLLAHISPSSKPLASRSTSRTPLPFPAMPSFLHRNQAPAADANLEKPAQAHPHDPRTSIGTQHTAVNQGSPQQVPIGDQSTGKHGQGGGTAWIYQRPSVGQWFKMYWVDLRAFFSVLLKRGVGRRNGETDLLSPFPLFSSSSVLLPRTSISPTSPSPLVTRCMPRVQSLWPASEPSPSESTKLLPPRLATSPSPSRMAPSSTPSSPTLSVTVRRPSLRRIASEIAILLRN